MRDRLDLGEHHLFGEVPLVDVADALLRPDDLVGEDRDREEEEGRDDDERGREVRRDRVRRAALHVAERPVGGREPEQEPGDGGELETELDDGVIEDRTDRVADRLKDLVHPPREASV